VPSANGNRNTPAIINGKSLEDSIAPNGIHIELKDVMFINSLAKLAEAL
jgi:hypothetical protein